VTRARQRFTLAVLLASLCAGAAADAGAASGASTYPVRPVRVIVPFAPGGSDVPARMLAQRLSEKLGQPIIVDNRPGASGVLGADIAAKATPDGYTLLFATASHAVTPAYYEKLPYDAVRDFAPVARVGAVPFSLATHPSIGASTMKDFIAVAKAKAGQLNYASPGTGSIGHLANVLLLKETGLQATHVGYKGTGPAVTALLAGEVQFMMPNLIGALPHLRSGRLRVLGVASAKRAPSAPELPTFAEQGVRGADSGTWYCVLAPRGTPQGIVDTLNREITARLNSQGLRDQLATVGVIPETGTSSELAAFIRSEMEKWSGVMNYAGLTKQRY
jgi:tripartite-type tricarboxylate transporter receptor subunit TctC